MNHGDYRDAFLQQQQNRLSLVSRRAYADNARGESFVPDEPVFLRLCRVHDDPALERLAQLEGTRIRSGRYVIAEVNGTIVAAQPLDGGAPIADPFQKTAQVLPLLRLRVEQLAEPTGRRGRWHVLALHRLVI
ncbi:MAG TPA: hypothetical protein VG652_10350 [Gaiellaceae bacterium]|nr:hypothetical protein [Gaiellaceae bacterium]